MKGEIRNAKITKTALTMEDHGALTFWVFLEGSGWSCGYGGYCLGHGYLGADHFDSSARGLEAMMRIMDVVGVDTWEKLPGHYVRTVVSSWSEGIKIIGNITQDKWFNIDEFFKQGATE